MNIFLVRRTATKRVVLHILHVHFTTKTQAEKGGDYSVVVLIVLCLLLIFVLFASYVRFHILSRK